MFYMRFFESDAKEINSIWGRYSDLEASGQGLGYQQNPFSADACQVISSNCDTLPDNEQGNCSAEWKRWTCHLKLLIEIFRLEYLYSDIFSGVICRAELSLDNCEYMGIYVAMRK
ncbi:hypothetical protein GCM10007094_30090 [Pseudovibrio japonicus]|uniref:Uncharacterized protein n=1 Tax=Pseudovibrio japonicus TaxID=366534 RepID=A0ABQ3EGU6_9HYPH|nr:hypothetical protein GCM10007094_30090 [Pseudovibrio japonicus]